MRMGSRRKFGKQFLRVSRDLLQRQNRKFEMAFPRTAAFRYLRRANEQNRLAHAYLIWGSPGSGKQLLAAELASLVNGTKVSDVFSAKARDIFVAQPESKSRRIVREQIKSQTDQALKQEESRYKDSTDGAWLEEREQYYKALAESLYLQRRAALIETLFAWWSDVLRSRNGVECCSLPNAGKETAALAKRFSTAEILRRVRCLEELRYHLSRNIQEALAIEVAFLAIFTI